jgi:hypothetical protein
VDWFVISDDEWMALEDEQWRICCESTSVCSWFTWAYFYSWLSNSS